MGYDIYIGSPYLQEFDPEWEDDEMRAWYSVDSMEHPDAPNFKGDEMTANTNHRHPSYSAWADFTRRNGLYEFFFDDEKGLMRQHPGCFRINKEHLVILKEALKKRELIDNRPAGLDPRMHDLSKDWVEIPMEEQTHDYDKVRLHWLIFWFDWALNNCKCPAIRNS